MILSVVNTILVAEVVPEIIVGIVAGAHGIQVELLHHLNILNHAFARNDVTTVRIHLPYLITTFTGNINNFNVIYLLTAGAPVPVGATAGKTDLLVTWLYKLTVDLQYFNVGAVVGILTFVILAVVSLITYRNTGSYKNEEGFQ